jgi:hypothetical protein
VTAPDLRATVAVRPATALEQHRRLFDALEAAFAVRFVGRRADARRVDGSIVVGDQALTTEAGGARPEAPTLSLAAAGDTGDGLGEVRVVGHVRVDRCLWDVVLRGQNTGPPLQPAEDDEPLALSVDGPAWVRRNGSLIAERVSTPLPSFDEGMTLFEALHGQHSLSLVALVHFLRRLASGGWSRRSLRCAFVFDDPNLRRARYGYINYPELVRHADDHGYHAAMAMVPLDARHWSEGAVAVFRGRPDRLSLVMHGNNHSTRELTSARDLPAALALGAQALRRMARFASATGLEVDRVMMPPHAVWSRVGARALGALGYDALSSTHPYPSTEDRPGGRALAGWTGVDFVDGCAVVPRVSLQLDRTGIAIRAFLDQPLILYGHHDDVADGLEPLAAAAAVVNGLGDVRWCSVGEIVRCNHERRVDPDTITVRPGAQRIRVTVPEGVGRLRVQAPLGAGVDGGLGGWTVPSIGGSPRAFGTAVPVNAGEVLVRLHSTWDTDPRTVTSQPASPSALLRRRLSELRDQLAPLRRSRTSSALVYADADGTK